MNEIINCMLGSYRTLVCSISGTVSSLGTKCYFNAAGIPPVQQRNWIWLCFNRPLAYVNANCRYYSEILWETRRVCCSLHYLYSIAIPLSSEPEKCSVSADVSYVAGYQKIIIC